MIIDKIKKKIEFFYGLPFKGKLMLLLPYFVVIFLITRFAELYRLCNGNISMFLQNMAYIYKTLPRFTLRDLGIGMLMGIQIGRAHV